MPKKAELKHVKVENGKRLVDISAKYSSTGKRRRLIFTSVAKAQAEVGRIKSHLSKYGSLSNRFADEEYTDARAALSMLKNFNLKEDRDRTLKAAVKHFARSRDCRNGIRGLLGVLKGEKRGQGRG